MNKLRNLFCRQGLCFKYPCNNFHSSFRCVWGYQCWYRFTSIRNV